MARSILIPRRDALRLTAASAFASLISVPWERVSAADDPAKASPGWLRKTLKAGMIQASDNSLQSRFELAKEAGFEGVELSAPGIDVDKAKEAAKQAGIILDGTVGGYHWSIRHTDPDPNVRRDALKKLRQGIQETAAIGADSMLLVPGHGNDGAKEDVYQLAVEEISKALPDAEKHGVKILIENVWNHFLYDHEGGNDQTADQLAQFVDEFDSPWVGVQFDIGNHWKYGDPAAWIRTLGTRIKKLDIKGFSRQTGQFTKITEGDIDWPSVKQALRDIKFTGWVAAEVGGGGLERLKEISKNMDDALQCGEPIA